MTDELPVKDTKKVFEQNDELYEILRKSCVKGLPTLNSTMFIQTTKKYGKGVFRRTLANYITNEKPPFPLKEFDENKVVSKFHKLKQHDWTKWISKRSKEDVLEKYDDYKYPYSEYGLGVIDAPPIFNSISDSFMNPLRLACGSYGFKSPVQRWNEGDNIWGVFGPIWRGINDTCELNHITYLGAFRLGTYIATQFKPTVAKTIYEMTEAKTVLDTSMGWGDRLTGFYASNATTYIGCDPNPNTFAKYKEMIEFYDKLTGGKKTVKNVSTKTKNVKKSEFIGKPHYLDDSPKVIDFFTDAKSKNSSGFFGLYKNPKTGKMAFDPTKRMVGSPEDIGNIDNIVKIINKK